MPTTIQIVDSSDTPNQGRTKWNTNDTNLKATADALEAQQAAHVWEGHPSLYYTKTEIDTQQAAQDAALTAHKTGSDHDGRYDAIGAAATVQANLNAHKTSGDHDARYDARYVLSGTLSSIVRTLSDQVIDGIKTFLKNPRVKGTWPAYEMYDADGNPLASIRAGKTSGKNRLDVVLIKNGGAVPFLSMLEDGKVQMFGKDLATEEFVHNTKIANDIFGFTVTKEVWQNITDNSAVVTFFTALPVKNGAKLIKVVYGHSNDAGERAMWQEVDVDFLFTAATYTHLKAYVSIDANNQPVLHISVGKQVTFADPILFTDNVIPIQEAWDQGQTFTYPNDYSFALQLHFST